MYFIFRYNSTSLSIQLQFQSMSSSKYKKVKLGPEELTPEELTPEQLKAFKWLKKKWRKWLKKKLRTTLFFMIFRDKLFLENNIQAFYMPSKDVFATFLKARMFIRHKFPLVRLAFHRFPTETADTFNKYLQLEWSNKTLNFEFGKLTIADFFKSGECITWQTPERFILADPEFRNARVTKVYPFSNLPPDLLLVVFVG